MKLVNSCQQTQHPLTSEILLWISSTLSIYNINLGLRVAFSGQGQRTTIVDLEGQVLLQLFNATF